MLKKTRESETAIMLIALYRLLTIVLAPFVGLFLLKRRAFGKEHSERMGERLGRASFPRPNGAVIWMHGASVGEVHSILPLIKALLQAYPHASVLLTSGTVTSAQLSDTKLPERAYHQFVPVDTWFAVRRFLDHWKPDLAIWAESELWPNLVLETSAREVPMALLNARMSVRSYHLWCRFPKTIRKLVRSFNLVCPQSPQDMEHFQKLGARNLHMAGNLKHDSPPLPADSKAMGALVTQIADRRLWVAASTHSGEEMMAAHVHEKLKKDYAGLLTIIAPRHPERGEKMAATLREEGWNVSLRSQGEEITEATDIYIADTIGELGIFYRIAGVVFVGGSLVDRGGQNPMEAARLDCALITGPHTGNFTAIYSELEAKKALVRVQSEDELAREIADLLRDHARQEELAQIGLKLATEKQGVLNLVMEMLSPLLAKSMAPYPAPTQRPDPNNPTASDMD